MKLLFIVTSFWAYGELLIALDFAKACESEQMTIHFMIPPTHKKILEQNRIPYTCFIPQSRKINKMLMQDLEMRMKPDCIILSDFLNYHFCEKHYGITPSDLEIFSGKLGTFDNFDWQCERTQMDTYGFASDTVRNVNIDDYGFQLVPVPIAHSNRPTTARNQHRYGVLRKTLDYTTLNKEKNREKHGIPQNEKMILTTVATWQQGYKAYSGVKAFIDLSDTIYESFLEDLAKDHIVVVVGKPKQGQQISNQRQQLIEKGRLRLLDSLSPEIFEEYALSCDLFLTKNVTSTTTIKLVLSQIPCLQIRNTYTSYEEILGKLKDRTAGQMIARVKDCPYMYRYEMYPVGWYEFLKPVVQDNEYMNLMSRVEQFDWMQMKKEVNHLLYDEAFKKTRASAVARFNEQLSRLPKPPSIIRNL